MPKVSGLIVPKLCHRCHDENIRCLEPVAPFANHHDYGSGEDEETQLQHLQGFLAGIRKKLSNERFVANAPEAVVASIFRNFDFKKTSLLNY